VSWPGDRRAPSSPAPAAAPAPPATLPQKRTREAATAAKTDTFLGERSRRLVKRSGKRKALVAVARSILVLVWHLLADPTARFHHLGADYHARRIDQGRKTRNLVRQLEALGHTVTPEPAA
jgi:transposase